MEIASQLAAGIAQSRADFAYGAIKQNADSQKAIANVLDTAASSVPGSEIRGTNVNIKA